MSTVSTAKGNAAPNVASNQVRKDAVVTPVANHATLPPMQRTTWAPAFKSSLTGAVRDSVRIVRKAPWVLFRGAFLMLLAEAVFELAWLGAEATARAAQEGGDATL